MKNINFLNNNKPEKKIITDLKKFLEVDKKNKISVLPDVHLKRGEMSPTGCVLVSDKILPSFTHLSVGSGISFWSIEVDKNFEIKKFDKLFNYLQKKIPGQNKSKKKFHNFTNSEIDNFFKYGPKLFFDKKYFNKSLAKNIENGGNFLKKIKNKISYEQSVPAFIKEIGQKNFGTLGTGNTFIELHEMEKSFVQQKKNKKKLFFYIHSGLSEAFLTLFYSPRWGLRGKKFIPFEKHKWNFHGKSLFDKETILNKKNFFPGSSKYFGLEPDSYDGRSYLSAMAYTCNIAISNRIYLASIINKYIKKKFKINNMNLIWDCTHDSIQKKTSEKKTKIVHRHGASPVYNDNYINKYLKKNKNYKKFIIPSRPGGETLVGTINNNITKYNNSICHGTGRIFDRPEARKKFNHNLTKKEIMKKIKNLYSKMKDISGENPNSFRSIEEIISILDKKKLIKKEFITKPIYILKS